jgi:hypothetical protein
MANTNNSLLITALPGAGSKVIDNGYTEITPIATVLVASFRVYNKNSYSKHKANQRIEGRNEPCFYFGFDWVELDYDGKIEKIHGEEISKCTHIYEGGNSYTEATIDNVRKYLNSQFKTFVSDNGKEKYSAAQSWIYLRVNEPIKNLKMILDGNFRQQSLEFEIPEGIILEYTINGKNFIPIQYCTGVEFSKKEHQIRITATREIEKAEIKVYLKTCVIGSLGVIAKEQKTLNVYLWAVIKNPKGILTTAEKEKGRNEIMFDERKRRALKDKLDSVFHQVGLDIILHDEGIITYDPDSLAYKELIDDRNINTPEKGEKFFTKIKENNTALLNNPCGVNLMLADVTRQSVTETTKESTDGLGDLWKKNCIVFKQSLSQSDYGAGICAHEIGHTLGLIHTFHDMLANASLGNILGEITRLENNLELNKGKDSPYISEFNDRLIEERTKIMPMSVLFQARQTENVMDYNNDNYDYLFKWQWEAIRSTLTQSERAQWVKKKKK